MSVRTGEGVWLGRGCGVADRVADGDAADGRGVALALGAPATSEDGVIEAETAVMRLGVAMSPATRSTHSQGRIHQPSATVAANKIRLIDNLESRPAKL